MSFRALTTIRRTGITENILICDLFLEIVVIPVIRRKSQIIRVNRKINVIFPCKERN